MMSESSENIKVSICCNTYNHEKYIKKALDSFLMQKTNFKFEVWVHDDASTDRTSEIIKEYAEKYPEIIKPILQTENQYSKKIKITDTYVLPKAKGKYLALCEGDDYWISENKLQKQIDYMETHPECTLCIHNATRVNVDGKAIGYIRPVDRDRIVTCEEVIWGDGGFCATNSIVVPMRVRKNRPDFFEILSIDYIQQIYYASQGQTYCFEEEMSAYRTDVPGSWSIRMNKNKEAHTAVKRKIIDVLKIFDEFSEYKYHEIVERRCKKFEIDICELNRDFSRLKDKEFCTWLNELAVREKIFFFAKMICPKIFNGAQRIKGRLKCRLNKKRFL